MDAVVDHVLVLNDVSESEEVPASTSSGSSITSTTVTRSNVYKRKQSETPDFLERYLLSKEARESEKEERREQRRKQNDDNYLFALETNTKEIVPSPTVFRKTQNTSAVA